IRGIAMANPTHDINELRRRMQGAIQLLKQELGGLRTGRASASLLEPVQVEVRHVRRDGLDVLKRLEKDHKISEDDGKRSSEQVQKATDEAIGEVDKMLATKEREILTV